MMRRGLAILFLLWMHQLLLAQENRGVGFSGVYGTTLAHTDRIANLKSTNPIGLQLDFYKQKTDSINFELCHCYPQSGLSISFFNYGNNEVVGQGIHTTIYIEPQFQIARNLYFTIRGVAGLAFMNRPYDSIENPSNLSYSLPISGFVSLAPGLRYYFGQGYSSYLLLPFNHVSNGGIKDPNLGLNFPGVQLGMSKDLQWLPRYSSTKNRKKFDARNEFRAVAFWSSRTVKNGEKKRFHIYGAEVNHSYQFRPIWAINSGMEFYRDHALQERYRRETGVDESRYRLGAMSGLQIILGRFELQHRIGVYLYDPGLYNGRIFHRHGLSYRLNQQWQLGVQVKAHKEVANFLDFRASYRIR